MKKNKDRLLLIYLIISITFLILIARLFSMTLVQGDKFSEEAETKMLKQVTLNAPRGKIYDREGELLAGNKGVYNLNIYKDRLDRIDTNEKNKVFNNLIHILEEDGNDYLSDFYLSFNEFIYENPEDYLLEKKLPKDKVVDLLDDKEIIRTLIISKANIKGQSTTFTYYPINTIMDFFEKSGKDYPIEVVIGDKIKFRFIENERYFKLLEEEIISEDEKAFDFIVNEVYRDKSLIYNLLGHPMARKIVYSILENKNLTDKIILSGIEFKPIIAQWENKSRLSKLSSDIKLNTGAREDFISLIKHNTLEDLLTSYSIKDDEITIPAEILINNLESNGIDTNLTYRLDESSEKVIIEYKEKNSKEEEHPLNTLIKLSEENQLTEKFLLNNKIIYLAEQSLFNANIYPGINKSKWIYTNEVELSDLYERYRLKEKDNANNLFNRLVDRYKLEDYSNYEKYALMSIYDKVNSQGYLAYLPVKIASNISRDTIAEIEEKTPKNYGIEVELTSNRYYPNDNLASHLIGYLGRLPDEEVKDKKGVYDSNDIVGRTGVEESFEELLRGEKGKKVLYTNVMGETTKILEEKPAVAGDNVYLTINKELQEDTEKILKDTIDALNQKDKSYKSYYGDIRNYRTGENASSGAAIVMNTKTGEILSMASYPNYNPNLFVNGISNNDWNMLSNTEDKGVYSPRALLNVATQSALSPGSTFKPVTALAALEKGLDPNEKITCDGYVEINGSKFACWIHNSNGGSHGPLNLMEALGVSCNYYFYALALGENPKSPDDIKIKLELEDIELMTKRLKLNEKTGIEINVPYESSGETPNFANKQNIVKSMLKNVLLDDLEKYKKDNVDKNSSQLIEDIDEIISWVDQGPAKPRNEVIESLEKMGYKSEFILEGDRAGLADRIKYTYLNQSSWTNSDSLNMVIGQGQNAYTPMQILQLTSIIAMEGELNKPTIIKEVKDHNNKETISEFKKNTEFITMKDNDSYKYVKEGMRQSSMSLNHRQKLPFETGAKTGTAETSAINPNTGKTYDPFAWEMTFAPYEDPEIATIMVIYEGYTSSNLTLSNTDLIYSYYKHVKKDPNFQNERN